MLFNACLFFLLVTVPHVITFNFHIVAFRLAGEEVGWRDGAPLSDPGPGLAQRLPPGSLANSKLLPTPNYCLVLRYFSERTQNNNFV
jgi:hypothetical protein